MNNDERLNAIKNRYRRYGNSITCPECNNKWWHENEDYLYNCDGPLKKLQCPVLLFHNFLHMMSNNIENKRK